MLHKREIDTAKSASAYMDTKPHYELLDGLRGVAALIVIVYHIHECFPVEYYPMGHGHLAVDFFFMLSGFVIGYAYDDRWKKMSVGGFFKRRIIRLHPMVIMGTVIGAVTFYIQGGTQWDGTQITLSAVMIAMLCGMLMIPAFPGASYEVRGNSEMFPLNGPQWSLFFEYMANIIYALLLRRLSTRALTAFTVASGAALTAFVVTDPPAYGNMGVGWSVIDYNFIGGVLRMMFPFSVGLLMSRNFKPVNIKGAFWICTALIAAALMVPNLSIDDNTLYNRLYELAVVACVYPIVVYLAASGRATDKGTSSVCRFLGDISFPLYIVHYPTMYLFYHYIGFPETFRTPSETWPIMLLLFFGNIALAYICLKLYDEPVRRWLTEKFK